MLKKKSSSADIQKGATKTKSVTKFRTTSAPTPVSEIIVLFTAGESSLSGLSIKVSSLPLPTHSPTLSLSPAVVNKHHHKFPLSHSKPTAIPLAPVPPVPPKQHQQQQQEESDQEQIHIHIYLHSPVSLALCQMLFKSLHEIL